MLVKELIDELLKKNPDDEIAIALYDKDDIQEQFNEYLINRDISDQEPLTNDELENVLGSIFEWEVIWEKIDECITQELDTIIIQRDYDKTNNETENKLWNN